MTLHLLKPHWPAPAHVHACITTRQGGVSQAPFASFNLGMHVADKEADVRKNRDLLMEQALLPSEPIWLNQTHTNKVVCLDNEALFSSRVPLNADASYTTQANKVSLIMTADCLPLLVCNKQGTQVAAIHAGWKGLAAGIIENTLMHFKQDPCEILVYLGPAIGPDSFEVGTDVLQAFTSHDTKARQAFKHTNGEKYVANLYLLATQRLQALGVKAIWGAQYDTFTQEDTFFSYRRDGKTGRMASLIWFE